MSEAPPGTCVGTHKNDPDRPRQATDGLLCAGCATRLRSALNSLPTLWDDLLGVLEGPWGERVVNDVTPLAIAENALPINVRVAQHRVDIAQQLASWGRMVAEEMGQHPPVPDVGRIVVWLADRDGWVFEQEWVDEYLHEVVALRGKALALLDTGRRGYKFLGPCLVVTDGHGECQEDVYAFAEADWATCRGCGVEHAVAERREWLVQEAADYVGTAVEVADLVGSFIERTISPATIKTWRNRGHLPQVGRTAEGQGLYRVGDVVSVAARFGQRRVG